MHTEKSSSKKVKNFQVSTCEILSLTFIIHGDRTNQQTNYGFFGSSTWCIRRIRTRTRTNTNPNDTEANAAGRSGNARALRKTSKY